MIPRRSGRSTRLAGAGGVLVLAGGLLFWTVGHSSDARAQDATTSDRPAAPSAADTDGGDDNPDRAEDSEGRTANSTIDAATGGGEPPSPTPSEMAATRRPWWKSGDGKLGNRVWHDLDRDGVQDDDEPGLAGIEIRLINGNNGRVVATGRSDARGWWGYTGLADVDEHGMPATFRFQVAPPPGYSPTSPEAGSDPTKDSNIGPDGISAGAALTVREGGQWLTRNDLDAGLVD